MSMTPPEIGSEAPPPPPKSGMSTGAKVLILLGILAAVLVLLCCGVGGFFVYKMRNMASDDPATIAAKTDEMTEIEIPEGLDPVMSLDVSIPFVGDVMLITVYTNAQQDSSLILFAPGEQMRGEDQEQMQQQMQDSLRQQGMGAQEEIAEGETHTKEFTIRGETAKFVVTKGEGAQTGSERIIVMGTFQGKEGPVMLLLNADAEQYTEEEITTMLESIE
jgi:hypothetical protein